MKIIILEFDGVLQINRSRGKPYQPGSPTFDRESVSNLNRLIELTHAKIVVTSSLRLDSDLPLQRLLDFEGVKGEVVGKTPYLGLGYHGRGAEIYAFVREDNLPIEKFVILDDDIEHDISDYFPNSLVRTDMATGFDEAAFKKALEVMNRSEPKYLREIDSVLQASNALIQDVQQWRIDDQQKPKTNHSAEQRFHAGRRPPCSLLQKAIPIRSDGRFNASLQKNRTHP